MNGNPKNSNFLTPPQQAWVVRGNDLSFEAAAHEDPKNPGSLKKVLARRDDLPAGRVQMVNFALLPVGKSFREHLHEDMLEVFVITTGSVEVQTNDQSPLGLRAGDAWFVPAGVRHKMRNIGSQDVQFVVFGISAEAGGKTIITSVSPSAI